MFIVINRSLLICFSILLLLPSWSCMLQASPMTLWSHKCQTQASLGHFYHLEIIILTLSSFESLSPTSLLHHGPKHMLRPQQMTGRCCIKCFRIIHALLFPITTDNRELTVLNSTTSVSCPSVWENICNQTVTVD